MVKKKKTAKGTTFKEAIGINNIFHNEKINFITGALILAFAVYMVLAFISFFSAYLPRCWLGYAFLRDGQPLVLFHL